MAEWHEAFGQRRPGLSFTKFVCVCVSVRVLCAKFVAECLGLLGTVRFWGQAPKPHPQACNNKATMTS